MKVILIIPATVLMIFVGISCKKQAIDVPSGNSGSTRKIQFVLYTDTDFANDNNTITFAPFIENSANQVLWDSTFTSMKIKDIPGFDHKITFEKIIPDRDSSLLKVGFAYTIENVGTSRYIDSFKVDQTLKVFSFNFR